MRSDEKRSIREAAKQARHAQVQKDQTSRLVTQRLFAMPEFARARCVLWYVDVRDEVRTRHALPQALRTEQVVVVPYCVGDRLQLFRMRRLDDLSPGQFGILEPKAELRDDPLRRIKAGEVDFVIVPGVAFDLDGNRAGHGKGYYDRLLAEVRPETGLAALAFECQIFPRIPVDDHDVGMDWVVTERRTIRCR